jgi:hypothetical protein
MLKAQSNAGQQRQTNRYQFNTRFAVQPGAYWPATKAHSIITLQGILPHTDEIAVNNGTTISDTQGGVFLSNKVSTAAMRTAAFNSHIPPRPLARRTQGPDGIHVLDAFLRPPTDTPAHGDVAAVPVTRAQEKAYEYRRDMQKECITAHDDFAAEFLAHAPPAFQQLMNDIPGPKTILYLLTAAETAYGANTGDDAEGLRDEALGPADLTMPVSIAKALFDTQLSTINEALRAPIGTGNYRIQAFLGKYPASIRDIADTILAQNPTPVLLRDAALLDTLVPVMENMRCATVVALRAQALAATLATSANVDTARRDNHAGKDNSGPPCWAHGRDCSHSTVQCTWLNKDVNAAIKTAIKGKRMNDTVHVTHDGYDHTLKSGFLGQSEWRRGGNGRPGGGRAEGRNTKRDNRDNGRRGGGHSAEDA